MTKATRRDFVRYAAAGVSAGVLSSSFALARERAGDPTTLRVCAYNVGHFNQGKLGGYQGDDIAGELERWRGWIKAQDIDIFTVQEWNRDFDKAAKFNAEKELLEPFYKYRYWGMETTWIYNGIATNRPLKNLRNVKWWGDYYAHTGELEIGGKTITLMSTHVPWQIEGHDQAVQDQIAEMKKYEYLICAGDMNCPDADQQLFEKAGFRMANGGNGKWFITAAAGSKKPDRKESTLHIDNIITSSNIKLFNISAPETGLTDDDHWPIIADVTIED